MEPYYILMKLPGSDQLEFLIMSPYTPQNRDNMISWLAARCDFAEDAITGKCCFTSFLKRN